MGQKFFQVGYNKFYPRIVSPGMTEVSVSDIEVRVIKIVNDKTAVEEVSSTEPIQFTQRVGREKWEEIFSSFKVPPTTFLGDFVLESSTSNKVSSISNDVKFIRSSEIYSTITNPIREDSRILRIEQSQSTSALSKITDSGIVRTENINSINSVIYPTTIGSSSEEDILSQISFENEQSIGTSGIENFLATISSLLSPSIGTGGSENILSSKFIRFSPSIGTGDSENILSTRIINKIRSVDSSVTEELFTLTFPPRLKTSDVLGIDVNVSEPNKSFEIVQAVNVLATEYISSTNLDSPPLGSTPDGLWLEVLLDDVSPIKVKSSVDLLGSETIVKSTTVSDRSSIDLFVLEELSSQKATKLIELVDRYIAEELSSISLSNELHSSLRNTLIEQSSAVLVNYLRSTLDNLNQEVVISGPPIPDYGMGIGALFKKMFIETVVVPSKSILFKKIFIEKAVVDISYLFTTLYLNSLTTELSFVQALGYGNSEYLNQYAVELCVPEEGKFTNEYIGTLFIEVSF